MLTEEIQTFDLPLENLNLEIKDYDIALNSSFFCNDILLEPWPQEVGSWQVVSGSISLSISNVQGGGCNAFYDLSIVLENAVFKNEANEELQVTELKLEKLLVGWFPG